MIMGDSRVSSNQEVRVRRSVVVAVAGTLFLAIGVAVVSSIRSSRQVGEVASSAREAVKAGRIVEARALIDRWSALAPLDGEPEYHRALAEVKVDRPNEALDAIRKALERGYPEGPLMTLRAVLLTRAGRFDEAEPVLRRAFLEDAGPMAEVAEGLARIYLRDYRLAEADRALDRWSKADPNDARPYLLRVEIDKRLGRDNEVLVRDYREALRRDPNLDDLRLELAEKLLETSSIDEAGTEFATLLARRPKSAPGHVGMGRVALLKGDIQAASRHFEEALSIDPSSQRALRELALIDLKFGRTDQARERLERAVRIDPNDLEMRYTYARTLSAAGDPEGAAKQTEIFERLKQEQKHIDELRKSLVQRPDDLDHRSEVAIWLIEHGHEQEGLVWTQLILNVRPDHPATCRFLADYYAKKANLGLANYYRALVPPSDDKPPN